MHRLPGQLYKFILCIWFVLSGSVGLFAQGEGKVIIERPKSDEITKEIRPVLKWKKYNGAEFYRLCWYEINPINRSVIKEKQNIITSDTYYQMNEDLIPNRVYQWAVQACVDKGNVIGESPYIFFITGNITLEEIQKYNNEYHRQRTQIEEKIGARADNSGPSIYLWRCCA